MSDQNEGAKRFGSMEQQRIVEEKRLDDQRNSVLPKSSSLIVVLSPTSTAGLVQALNVSGEFISKPITHVKSVNRLVDLLNGVPESLRGDRSAYSIFQPSRGVPVEILANKVLDNGYTVKILRYRLHLDTAEISSILTRALLSLPIQEGDDLGDTLTRSGILSMYVTDQKDSVNVIQSIEDMIELRNISTSEAAITDLESDVLDSPMIDFAQLPGASNVAVFQGAKRSFLFENATGSVVTLVKTPEGESIVTTELNQHPASRPVSDLDVEEMSVALTTLGYDVADWTEESIRDTYQAEHIELGSVGADATLDEGSDDLLVGDDNGTDEEDESNDESGVVSSPVDTFMSICDNAEYGRDEFKRAIYILGGTILRSDDLDTVRQRLVAIIEDLVEDEVDLIKLLEDTLIPKLEERGANAAPFYEWLDAPEDSSDEEEEEEEEESDEEDISEEDEAEGEDFSAVDHLAQVIDQDQLDRSKLKSLVFILGGKVFKSDSEQDLTVKALELVESMGYDEYFNFLVEANGRIELPSAADWIMGESQEVEPTSLFSIPVDQLSDEERRTALSAAGHDVTDMSVIAVAKLFNTVRTEYVDESDDQKTYLFNILSNASVEDLTTIADLLGLEYSDTTDLVSEIIDADHEGIIENLNSALANYGYEPEEDDEDLDRLSLLTVFVRAYFDDSLNDAQDENLDDAEEEEEEEEAEEGADFIDDVSDQIAQASGAVNNNPLNITGIEEGDDHSLDSTKFLIEAEKSPAGTLMSVDMPQSLIINFTLTDRATFEDNKELANIDNVNYLFPFNKPKSEDKAPGSMWHPAATMIETMTSAATSRFLVDRSAFDVEKFSQQLNSMFASELDASLYDGMLPAGSDPKVTGVKTGDFLDEDTLDDSDIDASYWEDFEGESMPMYSLINGHITSRPVTIEDRNSVLCLGVLNLSLPGVWSTSSKMLPKLIDSAVNAVKLLVVEGSELNVYVGFTLSAGSMIVDQTLSEAVDHLRGFDELYAYTSADAQLFVDNEDVLELASSLDNTDRLPLEVLSSQFAHRTFENGGDLTILIPCFDTESEDEEDEE